MQSAQLCKEAYEKAFIIENNLRAFASKVLIHFLGIDWLNSTGLEKEAESVKCLKEKFIQRVPEFDNINADFLSMTLETLVGVMFEGKIYNDNVVLNKSQYAKVWEIAKKNGTGNSIAEFIVYNLPSAANFYDLFCGGCAITHRALIENRWKNYYLNDIEQGVPQLFVDAVNGKYAHEKQWVSRDDFFRLKEDDAYIRLIWSFGNDGRTYLY